MYHGPRDLVVPFFEQGKTPSQTVTTLRCVITGRTVYHGPRDQVVPFFEQLGFEVPERKGVADFIQEVCSKKDQEVLARFKVLSVGLVRVYLYQCALMACCGFSKGITGSLASQSVF